MREEGRMLVQAPWPDLRVGGEAIGDPADVEVQRFQVSILRRSDLGQAGVRVDLCVRR